MKRATPKPKPSLLTPIPLYFLLGHTSKSWQGNLEQCFRAHRTDFSSDPASVFRGLCFHVCETGNMNSSYSKLSRGVSNEVNHIQPGTEPGSPARSQQMGAAIFIPATGLHAVCHGTCVLSCFGPSTKTAQQQSQTELVALEIFLVLLFIGQHLKIGSFQGKIKMSQIS